MQPRPVRILLAMMATCGSDRSHVRRVRGNGARRRTVRFCTLVLAVGSFAASGAPAASAHSGELSTVGRGGSVSAGREGVAGGRGNPSRSRISGARSPIASTRTVVDSARVSIFVTEPSGAVRGPYRTAAVAGTYYLLVPIADPSRVEGAPVSDHRRRSARSRFRARYVPPSLFREWLFEPWVLFAAVVAAAFFLQGFVRLRRRGRRDHASWGRLALFSAGLAVLVSTARLAARHRRRPLPALGAHAPARLDRRCRARSAAPRGAWAAAVLRGPGRAHARARPIAGCPQRGRMGADGRRWR